MTELIKTDENKINKYHNAKIYKIVNDLDDKVYIGSTCSPLFKRLYNHKHDCKDEKRKSLIYLHYRNIGSECMQIILVEEYKCNNKMELEKKEREYIEQYKGENCLNRNIPTRTIQEYINDNKEIILERQRKYREDNKEVISEREKEYRSLNKDKILERKKEYRKIKILCECGSTIIKNMKSCHIKTKKHINYVKNKNTKSE